MTSPDIRFESIAIGVCLFFVGFCYCVMVILLLCYSFIDKTSNYFNSVFIICLEFIIGSYCCGCCDSLDIS